VPGHQLRLFEGSAVCEVDGFTLRKKPDTQVVSKRAIFETVWRLNSRVNPEGSRPHLAALRS
jgi:hypothetical protein